MSWGRHRSPTVPVLHLPGPPPSPTDVDAYLASRLAKSVEDHPSAWVVEMLERGLGKDATRDFSDIKRHAVPPVHADRHRLDWVTALSCESAIDADRQLQKVRCDYLIGNLKSLLAGAGADHLRRTLFDTWDYADGRSNQSLHGEPSEDRRHAYQWHQPNGDPTRKRRGGMLGANRLALEAWPLFPSFPDGPDRVRTRGFRGNRAGSTFWLWPLWSSCLTPDAVASILSVPNLQSSAGDTDSVRCLGVTAVYRSQRILVGKTPNLTPADAIV
ncbi:CRISPR-associated helicase Cas3 [Frigoriglobus tundricola]|uniref:CRISPR-associated helicase Cas3 n=1 Tax=Frigoriglobus tundricola TaxID=2774151 RepID=A0A6M5YLE5_9BACT|nr:hypothetical protein [Frigoriglobus tundricola]QJW94170.1 CRISPR-associated helicase Cas3 [Frigoriglobus tundricola]